MKRASFFILILIILSPIFMLTGCGSVISKELRRQAREDLRFEALKEDPDAFRGEKVILGGVIINTSLKEDHIVIEVLQQPLGLRDRPMDTDTSGGRFLVQLEGFKDPEVYHKGRKITVFGEVMGRRVQKIGEMEFSYPLIKGDEVYLWKGEEIIRPQLHFGLGIYRRF